MKGHAEEGGNVTDSHEKENKKADEAAERAYTHTDPPAYRAGYVRDVKKVSGPTIKGVVRIHRMRATLLEHIHIKDYLS